MHAAAAAVEGVAAPAGVVIATTPMATAAFTASTAVSAVVAAIVLALFSLHCSHHCGCHATLVIFGVPTIVIVVVATTFSIVLATAITTVTALTRGAVSNVAAVVNDHGLTGGMLDLLVNGDLGEQETRLGI
jgi:hypothetical protein